MDKNEKYPLMVKNLDVAYGQAPPILRGLNFMAKPGEILGILGPSGCGKSSLLRHLIGLEKPSQGEILLFGSDLWTEGGRHLNLYRQMFGMMYQGGALFGDLSLLENVSLPLIEFTAMDPGAIEMAARIKLSLVGLSGYEYYMPAQLSGGMKKRAAIARALALEPGLLFLDEPAAGLDPITSTGLDNLIVTLARNLSITFVVVTHELHSIMTIVDRAILLDRNKKGIVAEGRPQDLAKKPLPETSLFFQRINQ